MVPSLSARVLRVNRIQLAPHESHQSAAAAAVASISSVSYSGASSCSDAATLYRHQLVSCNKEADGKAIHANLVRDGLDRDEILAGYIVHMYLRLGILEDARRVFDRFDFDDVGLWTTMVSANARFGYHREALQLFYSMQLHGVLPNRVTFVAAVNVCLVLGNAREGKIFFDRAASCGFGDDVVLGNSLLNLYGTCASLREARDFFEGMKQRDSISWTTLMKAYNWQRHWKESLGLFHRMQQEGSARPDKTSFIVVLSACTEMLDLARGRAIHVSCQGNGLEDDVSVASTLVNMYNKCGDLAEACRIFGRMPHKTLVSWNIMIAAYFHHGFPAKSLQLLNRMQLEGIRPEKVTFINSLNACSALSALVPGKTIHACSLERGFLSDTVLATAILNMYSKCGIVDAARSIFDAMQERNIVSWNAMIAAYAHNDRAADAILLFRALDLDAACNPNDITFATLLDACGEATDLRSGEAAHARIVASRTQIFLVLATALVAMYSKCDRLGRARAIFDAVPDRDRDVVLWTTMLGAYSDRERHSEALALFRSMRTAPDAIAFVSAVDAIANAGTIDEAAALHSRIAAAGLELDALVGSALCYMYATLGCVDRASAIFAALPSRTVVSWNAILGALATRGLASEAMESFLAMLREGDRPDEITFAAVLDTFVSQSSLGRGRFVHGLIVESGFDRSVFVGTALLNMYGKCGSLADALRIFASLSRRNTVSWNALIAAYASNGLVAESLDLFLELQNEGFLANTITFQSVIAACSHAGLVDRGCEYMLLMIQDHGIVPLPEHYSCMIDLLARAGWLGAAEDLVLELPEEERAFNGMALLSSCRTHGDSDRGRRVAKMMLRIAPARTGAYALLSNIYAGTEEHQTNNPKNAHV